MSQKEFELEQFQPIDQASYRGSAIESSFGPNQEADCSENGDGGLPFEGGSTSPPHGNTEEAKCGKLENIKKKVCRKRCYFLFFAIITVQAILCLKFLFYIFVNLQSTVILCQTCPEINSSTIDQQLVKYVFTSVMYGGVTYIGHWLEILIIHIWIYKFSFKETKSTESGESKKLCRRFNQELCLVCWLCTLSKLLQSRKHKANLVGLITLLSIFCLLVPTFGKGLIEVQRIHEFKCKEYIYVFRIFYWLLDIIDSINNVLVHFLMVLATMATGEIWSTKNNCVSIEHNNITDKPNNFTEYLNDKRVTSFECKSNKKIYDEKCKEVRRILEIFETWFFIPWILYFIRSLLNTNQILNIIWRDGQKAGSGDDKFDYPEIVYMVQNFNQIILLAVAFLCSKSMNIQHQQYCTTIRCELINKYEKSASKRALVSMCTIEKNDDFDFVPHIFVLSTCIKIKMENPFVVTILFANTFFAVAHGLI